MAESPAPVESQKVFSYPIFSDVREAQLQNGLRHNDFHRYREYCTRRLKRTRSALNFHYGRQKFQKKVLEPNMIKEARFLSLPLIAVERAWAYAMELRGELTLQPERRAHFLRRLAKATHISKHLLELCRARADDRTQLEAEAYASWMAGQYHLEREEWEDARTAFGVAQRILTALQALSAGTTADAYAARLADIAPGIRLAFYHAAGGAAAGPAATRVPTVVPLPAAVESAVEARIATVRAQAAPASATSVASVSWRGRDVPVRAPRIGTAIATAQQRAQETAAVPRAGAEQTAAAGPSHVDEALAALDAAAHAWRAALRAVQEEQKPRPDRDAAEEEALRQLGAFVRYHMNEALMQRHARAAAVMADRLASQTAKAKPDQIARLYRKIIMLAMENLEQPGIRDDPAATAHINARILVYRGYRCLYLALREAHAQRWANASGLLQMAAEMAQSAAEEQQRQTAPFPSTSPSRDAENLSPDSLSAAARAMQLRVRALMAQAGAPPVQAAAAALARLSLADTAGGAAAAPAAAAPAASVASAAAAGEKQVVPLLQRLQRFDDTPAAARRLADAVPPLEPIACKPLFFDVAIGDVQFPDVQTKLAKSTAAATGPGAAAPKRGGLLSGLFGR